MTHRFLFVNTREAKCSIYKSGLMFYNSVKDGENWTMDYIEVQNLDNHKLHEGKIVHKDGHTPEPYDVIIFNYHDYTMRVAENVYSEHFGNLPGVRYAIVLEMEPNNPVVNLKNDNFHGYIVLDPTLKYSDPRFHAFPRPLEEFKVEPYKERDIPVIGSFGLPHADKGFDLIVKAVNEEFERAIVRLNLPQGTYTQPFINMPNEVEILCKSIAKPGIEVIVTQDFMSDEELVKWCSENTINAFFYTRTIPGLAAATDQAITSGRPLATSSNKTFRHILEYQPSYPSRNLRETIEHGEANIAEMQKAWSYKSCQDRLTKIIFDTDEE
jgi:hypothetical protein